LENLYDKIQEAATFVTGKLGGRTARIAIVLGSGLGDLADEIQDSVSIPYAEIPHFAQSTVQGHAGRLVAGKLGDFPLIAMQGRLHFYEGHDMTTVTFPVRVLKTLGVEVLILTNAAGGMNKNYRPGDLMGLRDHIFMPGMAGFNPLRGPNDERLGPRFPAVSNIYPPKFLDICEEEARHVGINFHRGVYVMVAGSNFESQAELRFLKIQGDAVGMSTAPEAIVAAHGGMKVLGISTITNTATGEGDSEANHEEVLAVGREAGPRLAALIKRVLPRLG
jgi:purine-nucleoside phosphorylase